MTYHRCQRMTVGKRCICLDILQIPAAVAQMVYLCISLKAALARQEIGAVALGFNIGRYGIDRVARHEVMQVQIIDAHIGIVGNSFGYKVALGVSRNAGATL